MELDLSRIRRTASEGRRPWHGAAFVVESLVLLAFLVASLAVVISLMGDAHARGQAADELSNAIIAASNSAEEFAADPAGAGDGDTAWYAVVDGALVEVGASAGAGGANAGDVGGNAAYAVTRAVEREAQPAGTLYRAHIAVKREGATVYELDTSRYVSDAANDSGTASDTVSASASGEEVAR